MTLIGTPIHDSVLSWDAQCTPDGKYRMCILLEIEPAQLGKVQAFLTAAMKTEKPGLIRRLLKRLGVK